MKAMQAEERTLTLTLTPNPNPNHSLAAAADGVLFSWGSGSFGKLGHGEPVDESTPRPIAAIKHQVIVQVSCGYP